MLCQQMPLQSQGHPGVKSVVWGLKGSGHPIERGCHGHDQRHSRMGRPKAALVLSAEQRAQLESMASSRSLPAGLVTRVRIVLLSAAGKMN